MSEDEHKESRFKKLFRRDEAKENENMEAAFTKANAPDAASGLAGIRRQWIISAPGTSAAPVLLRIFSSPADPATMSERGAPSRSRSMSGWTSS